MKLFSNSLFVFLSLVILLLSIAVRGDEPTEGDKALEQLGWFAGDKWVTELKGADGNAVTVEATFKWARHRKAIHYEIVFGKGNQATLQYEGTYWWNPAKKQLALLQIDRIGNVTESTLTHEDKTWKQANTVTMADGTQREQRVEFARLGDDKFAFKAFIKRDNEWVEAVAFEYYRVREEKPAAAK